MWNRPVRGTQRRYAMAGAVTVAKEGQIQENRDSIGHLASPPAMHSRKGKVGSEAQQ